MIKHDRRDRRVTEEFAVAVVCDRCSKETRKFVGLGMDSYPFDGVRIRGYLYPTHSLGDRVTVEAELCGDCTEALRRWIASACEERLS